jgi:hypothetical protein
MSSWIISHLIFNSRMLYHECYFWKKHSIHFLRPWVKSEKKTERESGFIFWNDIADKGTQQSLDSDCIYKRWRKYPKVSSWLFREPYHKIRQDKTSDIFKVYEFLNSDERSERDLPECEVGARNDLYNCYYQPQIKIMNLISFHSLNAINKMRNSFAINLH